ncbi:hypothetical protein CANMA_004621 [Candida margitis]|uniref:uncharacterized protein n=1 Tax=Candida margitis TaxID=1775924 RepID=UPI00222721EB|nr:uncharacterized protein CANMA_004621 [Candida margitis]KAI5955404.1 hypothetical protein CANMA_004621 [Candida margitis]
MSTNDTETSNPLDNWKREFNQLLMSTMNQMRSQLLKQIDEKFDAFNQQDIKQVVLEAMQDVASVLQSKCAEYSKQAGDVGSTQVKEKVEIQQTDQHETKGFANVSKLNQNVNDEDCAEIGNNEASIEARLKSEIKHLESASNELRQSKTQTV